jgi:regulator of protease activity HflC (stomatin/prohibitin superfamily)
MIPAVLIVLLLLIGFYIVAASVKILREYERAVVFTLGRFERVKGPGLVLLLPFVQQMVRVDLRIQVIEIPSQDVISHDNVSMKVDAVLYFKVVDPERAIIQVNPISRRRTCLPRRRCAPFWDSTSWTRCYPSARN